MLALLSSSDDARLASRYVGEEVAEAQAAWRNTAALELLMDALGRDDGRLAETDQAGVMAVVSVDVLDGAIEAATDTTSVLVASLRTVAEGLRDLRLAVIHGDWYSIDAAIKKAGAWGDGV